MQILTNQTTAPNRISASEYKEGELLYVRVRGSGLDVSRTFDCGQCFRFEPLSITRHDYEVYGTAFGRAVSFANSFEDGENILYIYNSDMADFVNIWQSFLGLDTDYEAINKTLVDRYPWKDIKAAVSRGNGIYILKQEPWETVCSFIISQNNNIPRIKSIIRRMSTEWGERVACQLMTEHGFPDGECFAFPTAKRVADEGTEAIFALKTGFRAKYIADAAEKVSRGEVDFQSLQNKSDIQTGECINKLCEIKGVGPKVANCILLFSFGRYDAFPVDVWIKRAVERYFPKNFDPSTLGEYGGILQQYLFYYERYLQNS